MFNVESSFPRGFLYSPGNTPKSIPAGFEEVPVLRGLWVDQWLKVDSSSYLGTWVVVLGEAQFQERRRVQPSSELLKALKKGENEFFAELKYLAGRYVVLFGTGDSVRAVTDAAATRSLYYSNTPGLVASHARLVHLGQGGGGGISDFPFRNGYPGNFTPYKDVRLLTANLVLDLRNNVTKRYWPRGPLSSSIPSSAARRSMEFASVALQNLADERSISLALTAGFDSRLVLSAALMAGIPFQTFTYGDRHASTEVDRAVAADLSAMVGATHSVPPARKPSSELSKMLDQAYYASHHKKWVAGMMESFEGPQNAIVSGNLMELGRGHYTDVEKMGLVLSLIHI